MSKIEIVIYTNIDSTDVRSDIFADLFYCNEHLAVIHQSKERLLVNIYPGTQIFEIEFDELIEALQYAKERIYITQVEACFITMSKIQDALEQTIDGGKQVSKIEDILETYKSLYADDEITCPDGAEYSVNGETVKCQRHGDLKNICSLLEKEGSGYIQKCNEEMKRQNIL